MKIIQRKRTSKRELDELEARQRFRAESGLLVASAIRETAYALGHGSEMVTMGKSSCTKREIVCEGDAHATKIRFPDGAWVCTDLNTFMDRILASHNGRTAEEAEERLRKVFRAVKGNGDDNEPLLDGCQWLWCTIALMDGDVDVSI